MKMLVCVKQSNHHSFGDWVKVSDKEAEAYLSMKSDGSPYYVVIQDFGFDDLVEPSEEIELKEEPAVMEQAPEETAETAPAEPEPEPVKAEGRKKRSAN